MQADSVQRYEKQETLRAMVDEFKLHYSLSDIEVAKALGLDRGVPAKKKRKAIAPRAEPRWQRLPECDQHFRCTLERCTHGCKYNCTHGCCAVAGCAAGYSESKKRAYNVHIDALSDQVGRDKRTLVIKGPKRAAGGQPHFGRHWSDCPSRHGGICPAEQIGWLLWVPPTVDAIDSSSPSVGAELDPEEESGAAAADAAADAGSARNARLAALEARPALSPLAGIDLLPRAAD